MKSLILAAVVLASSTAAAQEVAATEPAAPAQATAAAAQTPVVGSPSEQTLFSSGTQLGAFGAPVVKFSTVEDDFATLVGARAGLVMDHSFWIGMGGLGLATDHERTVLGENRHLAMGYGGGMVGYTLFSDSLVHAEVNTLVGGGALAYVNRRDLEDEFDDWDSDALADVFFVVEPEVNVEVNVTSFLRMGAGLSYRAIAGAEGQLDNNDLSGLAGQLTFKFGRF